MRGRGHDREVKWGFWLAWGLHGDCCPLFQVSVTARDDVPFFGPPLPDPAVFKKVRGSPQPWSGAEQD